MSVYDLLLIALGLSMDAFAVSICLGLTLFNTSFRNTFLIAFSFGFFQAIMPLIGFFIGGRFSDKIMAFDHWIAFALLIIIGSKMIIEGFKEKEYSELDSTLSFKSLLVLAVATSIDALAAGISFAFLEINIFSAILRIGVITFILSVIGVKIGSRVGERFNAKAEIFGGFVLIFIGSKILLSHIGII